MNWTSHLEWLIPNLARRHKNIRTLDALENIIENLDRIPIEELESLVEKYGI